MALLSVIERLIISIPKAAVTSATGGTAILRGR
jgi:hypothetical protein